MRISVLKLGKVLGNKLVTLVAAHLFIPAGSLNVGLFLTQEGVTSLAGPEEATVRDSGCFVAEQQKAGSVQFKAGRHIWFRFMSTLSEQRRSITIYLYKAPCCSECLCPQELSKKRKQLYFITFYRQLT